MHDMETRKYIARIYREVQLRQNAVEVVITVNRLAKAVVFFAMICMDIYQTHFVDSWVILGSERD
jgi:hypothetical protein